MTPAGTNLLLAHADAAPAPSDVVTKSLRFNGGDSPILTRTPSSSGSQRIFTISLWVKRSDLNSTNYETIWASEASGSNYTLLTYYTDGLRFQSHGLGATPTLQSNAVFRDVSAWYHIVLSVDTTQATDTNRVKIYVNGSAITFSSATYPTLNYDLQVNTSSYTNKIGYSAGTSQYFDGYLADVNFIDGEQLTPTSFAEEDATTGQWKPKTFVGVYGTNGFHLDFKDSSDIGKDTSVDSSITATGGTVTTDGDYKVHAFSSTGSDTFEVTSSYGGTVEYLVVAGGGGGGGTIGGGGGAGGYRAGTDFAVSGDTEYDVEVGGGGSAGGHAEVGGDGTDSLFSTITSTGGGGGGCDSPLTGRSGGSGGGGGESGSGSGSGGSGNTPSTTPSQGNDGGSGDGTYLAGGGGGGADASGSGGTGTADGGGGTDNDIVEEFTDVTYAGGGGGSTRTGFSNSGGLGGGGDGAIYDMQDAVAGTANTGGGGGGGDSLNADSAAGGSGVVIIRYKFQ